MRSTESRRILNVGESGNNFASQLSRTPESMPVLRIRDVKLSYHDVGRGSRVVVLLHGFPFSADLWLPQIKALGAHYRTIAPDLRGFGGSDVPGGPYTMDVFADDVSRMLDALEIERAVIGGLSMGGYIAFEFYRRYPERVNALVLADTRPHPDTPVARKHRQKMAELAIARGSSAVSEQLIPKLLAPTTLTDKTEVVTSLRKIMDAARPEALAAALAGMALREDARPLLPQIEVPALVLNGAEDAITSAAEAREWSSNLPDARVEIIQNAGHVSNLEQPEAFNRALLDFLAESIWSGHDHARPE